MTNALNYGLCGIDLQQIKGLGPPSKFSLIPAKELTTTKKSVLLQERQQIVLTHSLYDGVITWTENWTFKGVGTKKIT